MVIEIEGIARDGKPSAVFRRAGCTVKEMRAPVMFERRTDWLK